MKFRTCITYTKTSHIQNTHIVLRLGQFELLKKYSRSYDYIFLFQKSGNSTFHKKVEPPFLLKIMDSYDHEKLIARNRKLYYSNDF